MRTIPYSSLVGSLMYAQVCTHPDIAFVVGMLGRYLSNPGSQHWKAAKKVLRYLQGTKDLMLTYQRTSLLDVVEITEFWVVRSSKGNSIEFITVSMLFFFPFYCLNIQELRPFQCSFSPCIKEHWNGQIGRAHV